MGRFVKIYDTDLKKTILVPQGGFQDYVETVSGSAKSVFSIGIDIDAPHKIDVSIDGRDQPIENTHWSRDISTNTITTSEPVNVGSVFKARVYL